MDFSLKHDRLVSLAASAMITASFLATAPAPTVSAAAGPQPAALAQALEAVRAANWQGLANATLPAPAAAPQSSIEVRATVDAPPLSDAQIQTLARLMNQHGLDSHPDSSVTTMLGLTKAGESIMVRELNIQRPELSHAYHVVNGGYLIYAIYQTEGHLMLTNSKQELVAAVIKRGNADPVVMPVADAQKELKAELAYWATVADRHSNDIASSH